MKKIIAYFVTGFLLVGGSDGQSAFAAKKKNKGSVKKEAFGKTEDGKKVDAYILTNKNGLQAKIITYGAMLTEMHVPDKNGKLGDVVLKMSSLAF